VSQELSKHYQDEVNNGMCSLTQLFGNSENSDAFGRYVYCTLLIISNNGPYSY